MTDSNEAPVEASVPTSAPNPANATQDRIAAAAEAMAKLDPPAPEPEEAEEAPSEPEEAPVDEAEAKPEPTAEKPRGRRQKGKEPAKPEGEAAEAEAKPRNMMRDLAAEWANARRAQKENQKRAAELAERQAQLEAEAAQAREVAMLMQGHPIKAVEKLAAVAGIRPSEYLQRLQQAYINGEDERPSQQTDAVARELAQLRAELQAEKQARIAEQQQAQYQQQVEQVTTAETSTLVELAKHYADEFPALQRIPDGTLKARVADAVQFYLGQGHEVGRFEVLQALNNIVDADLQALGIGGTVESRASGAPAASSGKSTNGVGQPKASRNGSHRQIPTNRDAADGGVRRSLTMEERLKEAEKVLWAASKR